jgi:uncharacterized protein
VDYLEQFVIPFTGLSTGWHQYNYSIDDEFFEKMECAGIREGKVRVDLNLEKQEKMIILDFIIKGYAHVMCDRCLDYYDQPLSGNERLIVKFGKAKFEETDEILVIPETDHQIDISPFIYEYINLLLPYKLVHPSDEKGNSRCNPDILRRIQELSSSVKEDPRWDVLKTIKFEDQNENN